MRGTWRRAYQGTGLIRRRGMGRTSGWAVAAAAEPVAVLDDVFPRQDRAYNVGSAAAKFVQLFTTKRQKSGAISVAGTMQISAWQLALRVLPASLSQLECELAV